jgi:hypothetical protein
MQDIQVAKEALHIELENFDQESCAL